MRCFIAIDIPREIKGMIGEVIDKLKGKSQGIRWVPASNIHITLKFLGSVEEEMVSEIEMRLSAICANYRPFTATVRGAGAFPRLKYPNVLWVGMDVPGELADLYQDIDRAMAELGFEREDRKFSPHLTIARVKDRRDSAPVVQELSTFKDTIFGTINIDEILLMRSDLKPTGAEYSKIAGFKLKDALSR
jgi:2'-5' RNA ligase